MSAAGARTCRTISEVEPGELQLALASRGLSIDVGATSIHTHSDSAHFALQLQTVYGQFPFLDREEWADMHVQVRRPAGTRRWFRPQVGFHCDGQQPFEPFPAAQPLPLYEWGCNWLIGRRLNDLLLLHAGALEKSGLALLLPALPGSGKSTLTAALSHRGWRLLSDEFGAFDPVRGEFRAILKPIALKNQSIAVIQEFCAQAVFGPSFPNTRKGTVAHLAPQRNAVVRRHEGARPGAVVLPRWEAGSKTRFEPIGEHVSFPALTFNSFNYALLGALGFKSAVHLARTCPSWQLVYSDLEDALSTIDNAWPQVIERHSAGTA